MAKKTKPDTDSPDPPDPPDPSNPPQPVQEDPLGDYAVQVGDTIMDDTVVTAIDHDLMQATIEAPSTARYPGTTKLSLAHAQLLRDRYRERQLLA